MNITFTIEDIKCNNKHIGSRYITKLPNKKGHFTIETRRYNNDQYSDMTIYVNKSLRDQGYSRKLIKKMTNELNKLNIKHMNILYIDCNASNGFWEYIGMINIEHPIFTKQIRYNNLKSWLSKRKRK